MLCARLKAWHASKQRKHDDDQQSGGMNAADLNSMRERIVNVRRDSHELMKMISSRKAGRTHTSTHIHPRQFDVIMHGRY